MFHLYIDTGGIFSIAISEKFFMGKKLLNTLL